MEADVSQYREFNFIHILSQEEDFKDNRTTSLSTPHQTLLLFKFCFIYLVSALVSHFGCSKLNFIIENWNHIIIYFMLLKKNNC